MWEELEHACQQLKHTSDDIDPYELRALLRRAQRYIELQNMLIDAATVPGETARRVMEDSW